MCLTHVVAQLVEHPLCLGAFGSVPGQVILKSLKWYQLLFSLMLSIKKVELEERNWSAQTWYNVSVWNIISCVWGKIFQ